MNFVDILTFMNERFTGFHILWSFYITVSVGILAYVAATFSTSSSALVRFLLIVAFIMFAGVNLHALIDVRDQREALKELALSQLEKEQASQPIKILPKDIENFRNLVNKGTPDSRIAIFSFHLILDVLTIFIIWYIPGVLARAKRIIALDRAPILPKLSMYQNPALISRDEINQVWKLENDFIIDTSEYHFKIPTGFTFDLASVPRFMWWLIAPFELSIAAPLVHDYLYRTGGHPQQGAVQKKAENELQPIVKISKQDVDDIFLEIMKNEGISHWRRYFAYVAVRIFGELSWRILKS